MNILQLTMHFSPNIGGLETHLDDLCRELVEYKHKVFVLTYQPLETEVSWKIYEKNDRLEVLRVPWIRGLFYKFVKFPILEFIYLLPALFILTPFVVLFKKIEIIHSHGLVAGFVGAFWGKVLKKKNIVSTHNIYNFPKNGLYKSFARWIFKNSFRCLTLSEQSKVELEELGVSSKKITKFTYWVDTEKFKVIDNAKTELKWEGFNTLFVGRLISEKGLNQLLDSAKKWHKKIKLNIIGAGPLEKKVRKFAAGYKNIRYIGAIKQDHLAIYYSGADLLIVPSSSDEGFGRVILESLACGTPVIGSNKKGIAEAMDESVGRLVKIGTEDLKKTVTYFFKHRSELEKLKKDAENMQKGDIQKKMSKKSSGLIRVNLNNLLSNVGDMALRRRAQMIIKGLDLKKGDSILDVGCGDGYYLYLLSSISDKFKLVGIDNDEMALKSARGKFGPKKINLINVNLMQKLPFADNSFDKVVMSEVAEHLSDDLKGFKQLYRVLKPGGIICVTVPNANYPFLWDPINWVLEKVFGTHIQRGFWAGIWNQHVRLYKRQQLEKVVKRAGFNILESKSYTWWSLPFNHHLINLGARALYGGMVPKNMAKSISKFEKGQKKQSIIFNYCFKLLKLNDKLNDLIEFKNIGMGIFLRAEK